MNVYLVEEGEYSDRYVMAICSSRGKALELFPDGDVRVMGMDDEPVGNVMCWWEVNLYPPDKWTAKTYHDAGVKHTEPIWHKWPLPHSQANWEPENGRIDINVLADSEESAINMAKEKLDEKEVRIVKRTHGGIDPWVDDGYGVPYKKGG